MRAFSITCRACGAQRPFTHPIAACPECGGGWLDAVYEYGRYHHTEGLNTYRWPHALKRYGASLWRYRDLLPLRHDQNIVTLGEGWTPLLKAHNLGLMLGHPNIYIKDERQGPTGSFKDRQAAIAVSALKEASITEAVVASTGNVAIAYSAYCARAGIKLWVFVPSSVPVEKMREMSLYGSEVIKVTGTYDQTKEIAAQFATSKNIFLDRGIKGIAAKEAMKTLAFEVAEQLGAAMAGDDPMLLNTPRPWRAPDWYVQAVSGGLGPVGVMKGFAELNDLGLIDTMPKLANVQPSGCAPMIQAFRQDRATAVNVDDPMTDIITLATGKPGEAYEVLYELTKRHGGTFEAVTDTEAFQALRVVAEMDGISVEPATAVAFAGLFKLIRQDVIQPHEIVVVNCSGHTFPVEKQIVGEHFTRDMHVSNGASHHGRSEGLLTALEELDDRVQRIAIIEDNADSARLVRRILQAQGDFLIDEANDGITGLALIQRTRPNLVILDLMMPGMDGFDIVEIMKHDRYLSNIPVIVITAKELTAVERERLDGKIKGLLQKGTFMDSDLLNDIRQALPT
ncbi:MAG: pyridoxal-phosphate dependent enzyme [Ardenticatenaceae bacterium]|nr:pyridoxal-phosphate dependent enzyme [Anaerolineales bacterium]MCB8923512.1 pyridoxal-phosphate dependent enzyme [Ardenticatenaceae bacterium]MCB9003763.1 pyridoxal-phosphate dependent enzyme [Ardenticatenaceae bacterium]